MSASSTILNQIYQNDLTQNVHLKHPFFKRYIVYCIYVDTRHCTSLTKTS